jgi:hypothetical protein
VIDPPKNYSDLNRSGHTHELEDPDVPRPWVGLSADQAYRVSRIQSEHPRETIVLIEQGSGYVMAARYSGDEGVLTGSELLAPVG